MTVGASPAHITLPRPPEEPAPIRMPIVAVLAPVVASVVLFLVLRSPYALAFAALGPVVAIGGTVDARFQRRRSRRRERHRFDVDCESIRSEIAAAVEAECAALERASPGAADVVARWRAETGWDGTVHVRVGTAPASSSIALDSPPPATDPGTRAALESLRRRARVIPAAPLLVDVAGGIAITGEPAIAAAVQRALVVQLAAVLTPDSWAITRPAGDSWRWLDRLPHRMCGADSESGAVVFEREGSAHDRLGVALVGIGSGGGVVGQLGTVTIDAGARTVIRDREGEREFSPDLVGTAQAGLAASTLVAARGGGPAGPPSLVEFAEVVPLRRDDETSSDRSHVGGLAVAVGRSATGVTAIDLVADGPHAIIGGMTGSGKSELLLSWVLAMAARRPPQEVTFLFVDFKGGASFAGLEILPHCVGVVTDLDVDQSSRALASLAAELRYRERALAAAGLRSIDDASTPPFARLVVVVDEYAALVDGDGDLHGLFLDIASRGRSLGVHLILCTQRPAGVVRDGILANAGLRISLRVTSVADSTALLGADAAALLPVTPRGRAILSGADGAPMPFQVARSTPDDVRTVAAVWPRDQLQRRPWTRPLAARILLPASIESPDGSIPFSIADLPDEQRHATVAYDPVRDGALVIVGGAGSGKSTTLVTLAAARSSAVRVRIAAGLPSVWDALQIALERIDSGAVLQPAVLLIDDLDAVLARAGADHELELVDRLTRVLRDGPGRGIRLVVTVQRMTGPLASALALCGSRLVLRMPDRHEHLLAGGETGRWSAALVPGAGFWRSDRVQVMVAATPPSERPHPEWSVTDAGLADLALLRLAVVASRPDRTLAELGSHLTGRRVVRLGEDRPGERDIVVGDPDAWQADWAAMTALRSGAVLFDGCSAADIRLVTRSRTPPPPFEPGARDRWLRGEDGTLRRLRLASALSPVPAANRA